MIHSSLSPALRPLLRRTLSSVGGIASGGRRQRIAFPLLTTKVMTTQTHRPPAAPIVQPWQRGRVRCLSQHAAERMAVTQSGISPSQSEEEDGVRRVRVVHREVAANPGRQRRRRPQRFEDVAGVGHVDAGSSCWISISSTPSFALLDDVLRGVEGAVQVLRSRGDVLRVATDGGGLDGELSDDDDDDDGGHRDCHMENARDEGEVRRQPPMMLRSLDDLEQELAEKGVGGGGPAEPLPSHLVLEARIILSRLKRPAGWYLRFPHPSIADAIVSQSTDVGELSREFTNGDIFPEEEDDDSAYEQGYAVAPLTVGWKRVFPVPFDPENCSRQSRVTFHEGAQLRLGDHVVRVENVHPGANDGRVRSFFRKYDLADERRVEVEVEAADLDDDDGGGVGGEIATDRPRGGSVAPPPVVERVVAAGKMLRGGSGHAPHAHTYLVRFGSASAARAAVRDLQFAHLLGRRLVLAQYPRQIL